MPQLKVDFVRKVMALAAAASLLLLSACGSTPSSSSGDIAPLSSVKITPGADDSSDPTVTFDTPLVATESAATVVIDGKGDPIKENQNVKFKLIAYNTEDGKLLGSEFAAEPSSVPTVEQLKAQSPALYETLMGAKVGSWIAIVEPEPAAAATPSDGASPSAAPAPAKALLVFKVISAEDIPPASEKLGPDEVKKLKDAGALPSVEMKDGKPVITIPKGKDAPAGLVVDVIKEGTGTVATDTMDATADYTGVTWSDGKQFDSSYDSGKPLTFGLGPSAKGMQVISGWQQGLVGLKAGSQVMLSIPADLAYGPDAAAQGRPAGTLVFFVDLKEVK